MNYIHLGGEAVLLLHRVGDLLTGELIPGRGDDGGAGILLRQKCAGYYELRLGYRIGAAHDDNVGVCDLIVEKLTEVSYIHTALARVNDCDLCAELRTLNAADGLGNVGKLADAGGLDDYAVGGEVCQHLFQSLGEVANEGAADAAGVHFGDLDTGVL